MSSDDKTVAVPVELLRRLTKAYTASKVVNEIAALIPKPKPRLVAVDLDYIDGMASVELASYLFEQPDLLTVLDDVIDEFGYTDDPRLESSLRCAIRTGLGVPDAE